MKKRFYAVSNAHLDTQWNWTIQYTIRKCIKNTLEENFRNFRQAPKYLFNFEGAFRYKLMQEYYPKHYDMVKQYVAEGRWHPCGAFWDSCDVNVPSSEALMRQALLGNKYFEKEFGIFTKDIFLPDCFGFRSSLPSIAKHMGLNGFSTQKLTWGVGCPIVNEDGTVSRPEFGKHKRLDLGKWKGPDESEIFVALNGGTYIYQFPEEETPVNQREWILKAIEKNQDISGFPWRSMYFGVGDEGGGCSTKCAQMVSDAELAGEGLYEVKNAYSYEIFDDLEKEDTSNMPTYKGHLYIPHGFGALTSHTISKRFNRLCENLGDAAERASVLASVYTNKEYPQKRLNDAWKTFLWHQFHDDLTGTSICDAYVFSHNDYAIALNQFAKELGSSVDAISQMLDTNVDGKPIVLFNSTGKQRTATVKYWTLMENDYVKVFDENNNEVPSQVSVIDGSKVVIFSAKVDAVGVAVYSVVLSDTPYAGENTLSVSENTLENKFYRVTINEDGDISSVYDKELGKELLSAPSRLEISPDNSTVWPSWELCFEDNAREHAFVKDNCKCEIFENGAAEVALRVTRTYGSSKFIQVISLSETEKVVSVYNYVDWFSRNSLLKATFPLTASNPYAEFDVGLGTDKGENTTSYPYFQHCVHTYADLTDASGEYGIAILNDCKYGMDKPDDNTLRLTLIHTPVEPYDNEKSNQDWQDFGRNEFRYGITSHKGERDGVALIADEFNKPIYPFVAAKHSGNGRKLSLVESNNTEVLIRAVKKEEDGNRIIVRLQEMSGKDTQTELKFACPVDSIVETDGYEREIAPIATNGNTTKIALSHFAPKTFAITPKQEKTSLDRIYTPIELPYSHKITTENGLFDSDFDVAIPAELFVKNITSSDVPFVMGDADKNNAVLCDGQTIKLPCGAKKLYILAAIHDGADPCEFQKDGKGPWSIPVSNMYENVGTWDMIAKSNTCYLNRDEIAHVYTHTHDKRGDKAYEFAYLFKYSLDVEGVSEITLPQGNKMLLFAATASTSNDCPLLSVWPLYPVAEKSIKPTHTITVEGTDIKLTMQEGNYALITAPDTDPNSLFDAWVGDAVKATNGMVALVCMPEEDATLSIKRRYLGNNLTHKKPATASNSENENETPDHAVNGVYDQKWCSPIDEKGAYMDVDLGKVYTVNRWLVKHTGKIEGSGWNTKEFSLQYKLNENDAWTIADQVTDNKDDITLRDIEPITARYVRLFVTKAGQDDDEGHVRIYEFSVFEA